MTKYVVEVETESGLQTVTAAVPHDTTEKVMITSVTSKIEQKTTVTESNNYVSKVTVDKNNGVITTVTSKPEDIKNSFVNKTSIQIVSKVEAETAQIQSILKKEYKEIVTETVVLKTDKNVYIQAVFEKNQTTNEVINIGEEILDVMPVKEELVLPFVSTTTISQTKFKQILKTSEILQNVTSEIIKLKPVYQEETPVNTQIEDIGPKKIIVIVYMLRDSEEKERIIVEYVK